MRVSEIMHSFYCFFLQNTKKRIWFFSLFLLLCDGRSQEFTVEGFAGAVP